MTAARTGGMSIRLEQRIRMIVSDQAKRLEVKRERLFPSPTGSGVRGEGRRRVITDPAISGVRGYSIPFARESSCFSKTSCCSSFMRHVLHAIRREQENPVE